MNEVKKKDEKKILKILLECDEKLRTNCCYILVFFFLLLRLLRKQKNFNESKSDIHKRYTFFDFVN